MNNTSRPCLLKLLPNILLALLCGAMCGCGGGSDAVSETHEDHEHAHGESDEIELSEAQMDAVGITLGHPESKALSEILKTNGVLAIDPRYEAVGSPLLAGTVSRICVSEGQKVGAGTVLAYIDAAEVPVIQQTYREAKAEHEAAVAEFSRQEALASHGAGVRKNLEAARSALSIAAIRLEGLEARMRQLGISLDGNSRTVPVKADISGTVTAVTVKTGGFADMQQPVATIIDNSKVYCLLKVFEKDIPSVEKGMEVEMRLTNNPSVTFSGKVLELNPVLEADTKTAPVKVSIDLGDKSNLIPGMGVSASITTGGKQVMAMPEDAVVSSGGKSYIFVLEDIHEEEGEKMYHFEKREVITGLSSMGYVEITPLQPLETDTKVVTSNAFFLGSMSSDHGEHSH